MLSQLAFLLQVSEHLFAELFQLACQCFKLHLHLFLLFCIHLYGGLGLLHGEDAPVQQFVDLTLGQCILRAGWQLQ